MSETQLGPDGLGQKPWLGLVAGPLVVSVLFSIFSPLLFVCLIPLQWLYHKTGWRTFILASISASFLMVGAQLVTYRIMFGQLTAAAVFDCGLPMAMVASLVLLNLRLKLRQTPAWLRILLAYAAILVIMVPTADFAFSTPEMRAQFETAAAMVSESFGLGALDKEWLSLSLELSLRCMPLLILVTVLFNWYAATWFWRRRLSQWSASTALANFRVAEYMVWPLLFGLAVLAVGLVAKMPLPLERGAVLLSLGMVFLYFLQGLGIISAFFERRRNPDSRPMSLLLVCLILFIPGLNMLALVVIPLLGVLEIWIHLRPATQV